MTSLNRLVTIAGIFTLYGCGGNIGGCPPTLTPAINLTVVDAETDESLACGITVEVYENDELIHTRETEPAPCQEERSGVQLLPNQDGTFELVVSKPGYQTWASDAIAVNTTQNGCEAITEFAQALLVSE